MAELFGFGAGRKAMVVSRWCGSWLVLAGTICTIDTLIEARVDLSVSFPDICLPPL